MLPRVTACMAALLAVLGAATDTAGAPRLAMAAENSAAQSIQAEPAAGALLLAATSATGNPAPQTRPPGGGDIPPSEPFRSTGASIFAPDLQSKWSEVETRIEADRRTLADCRSRPAACTPAAQRFLSIVDEGRNRTGLPRIGVINRSINLAIQPMADIKQWGVEDRWSPPLETFATGRGDCEDYAIAKYVALLELGIPMTDLRLVIVRLRASNVDHAILAVRIDGEWITLDNRTLMLVRDVEMPLVTPLFVIDEQHIRQIATIVPPAPAPASAGASAAAAR